MSIIYNKLRCVGDWDVGDVPVEFGAVLRAVFG